MGAPNTARTLAGVERLEGRRLLSGDLCGGSDISGAEEVDATPSARAIPFPDARGDILPTYDGVELPGMDVIAHKVMLAGDRVVFFGQMAGPIALTQEIGALYLYGVDRGRGTPRFLNSPAAPPVIGPNVVWDSIVRINPDGTGLFNNSLIGVSTPLDPADIRITGTSLVASVPLSLMLPGSIRPPEEWTYNLWPRNGVGRNVQVSDLAPDDGNASVQTILRNGSPGYGQAGPAQGAVFTDASSAARMESFVVFGGNVGNGIASEEDAVGSVLAEVLK